MCIRDSYYAQQNAKLKKYRLGLPAGQEAEAVDVLIKQMEELSCCLLYTSRCV